MLNLSLAGLLLLRPVSGGADGTTVVDFSPEYLNPAAGLLLARFPPAKAAALRAFYCRVFDTGVPEQHDVHYPADGPDGHFRFAAARNGPYLAVSFADFTYPRPAAAAAVRASLAREMAIRAAAEAQRADLQRVFEQAPVAVAVFRGPRYVVEMVNAAVCVLWGRTPAQALGTPLFDLLPEAAGQGFEELLNGVLATGVPHVAHELPSYIDRGGRRDTVHWNFVYQPLREADGGITGIIVVATDASEQVAARRHIEQLHEAAAASAAQLRASNAALEETVAARTRALRTTLQQLEARSQALALALAAEQELGELKSRFVAMASHEFRTPLTVVLSAAALVEQHPGGDQQPQRQKYLAHIRTSVQQLNDILEEFLAVGQLEDGALAVHPAEADLNAIFAQAVAEVDSLRKTGQTVAVRAACPGPVHLDASLLRKILVNLLANALKYSGPGAAVAVRAHCHEQCLYVSVTDAGVGISPEDQPHVFGWFFRARGAAHVPGTGLGLHIVARYVALMGGTIALRSALGQGTTFTLTLPYENHSAD